MDRYRYVMDNKEERKYQLDKWQKKWEQETGKAEWPKKLIPDVREFRLTQYLVNIEKE